MTQFVRLIAKRKEVNNRYSGFYPYVKAEFSFVTSIEKGHRILSLWRERQEICNSEHNRFARPREGWTIMLSEEERECTDHRLAVEASIDTLCPLERDWYTIDGTWVLEMEILGTIENIDQTVFLPRPQEAG